MKENETAKLEDQLMHRFGAGRYPNGSNLPGVVRGAANFAGLIFCVKS
jgi:hypothetical protein